MVAIDGVPLSLVAAELLFEQSEVRTTAAFRKLNAGSAETSLINSLRISVAQNELVAVGVFSTFEARMQELVGKRKFFQGLQELLIGENRHDLAHTIRMYYLAVNVLKHGAGSSHNELRSYDDLPFSVRRTAGDFFSEGDVAEPGGLIDVRDEGFLNGLLDAISEVHTFLIRYRDGV